MLNRIIQFLILISFSLTVHSATNQYYGVLHGVADASITSSNANTAGYSTNAGSVTGPQAAVIAAVTNTYLYDPDAANFIRAIGLADTWAKRDITIAVQQYKKYGVWTNVAGTFITMPRFNPQAQLCLDGITPFFTSNALYNTGTAFAGKQNGFLCQKTNFAWANIPALSNCTIVVTYKQSAESLSIGGDGPFSAVFDARNTNDGSAILATDFNGNSSAQIWTSAGGTFLGASDNNQTTNAYEPMLSGMFRRDGSAFAPQPTVVAMSYNSNGLFSTWVNGRVAPFNTSSGAPATNVLKLSNPTAPFNQVWVGGNNPAWLAVPPAGGTVNHTNANVEVYSVQIFNQSCEQNTNIPIASTRFAFSLFDYNRALSIQGDSRMNNMNAWYKGGNPTTPTNSIPYCFQLANPDVLVFNEAAPGSLVSQMTNMNGVLGGRYMFQSVLEFLPPEKYTLMSDTDAGYNDGSVGVIPTITAAIFNRVYSRFISLGIPVRYIEAPYVGSGTYAQNTNAWATILAIETNCNLAGVIPLGRLVTTNWVGASSIDNTHIGNNNLMSGHIAAMQAAQIIGGGSPPPMFGWFFDATASDARANALTVSSFAGQFPITVIQTNFMPGNWYTNSYASAIQVSAQVVNVTTGVAGSSCLELWCPASPSVGGWTNKSAIQTTLTSIAMNYTNVISIFVPTNAPFCFTNTSIGVGNSATVLGGQIKYP